ncbi:MAG: DNA cytosine methyltransferase [Nitrososphaerota archaeon]|nr:DNA cytosine methyltransferase [Nitrososphaerota archaeon]
MQVFRNPSVHGKLGEGERPTRRLRVVDLFCGAGGFSLGFKQLGFDVIYAVDNWKPAVETYRLNNPNTKVERIDATVLAPDRIPEADVFIGGPPCTEFSGSKLGGGGNVRKGMLLVYRFFHFVQKLRPRWWVMENVPRLPQSLPPTLTLKELGISEEESYFDIPKIKVFDAADFGVPQKRIRAFLGKYPDPVRSHSETGTTRLDGATYEPWIPMRRALDAFPSPFGRPEQGRLVRDPLYDFALDEGKLRDHFGRECVLTEEETTRNRNQKTKHPYYGKMRFPDAVDRPARTVMATQIKPSRETMVIQESIDGGTLFRRPTVRECATLQGYPINYAFVESSLSTRYRLVGNSVPVGLSRAIAAAIRRDALSSIGD